MDGSPQNSSSYPPPVSRARTSRRGYTITTPGSALTLPQPPPPVLSSPWREDHASGAHSAIFARENITGTIAAASSAVAVGLQAAEGVHKSVPVAAAAIGLLSAAKDMVDGYREGKLAAPIASALNATAGALAATSEYAPEPELKQTLQTASKALLGLGAAMKAYQAGAEHGIAVAQRRMDAAYGSERGYPAADYPAPTYVSSPQQLASSVTQSRQASQTRVSNSRSGHTP